MATGALPSAIGAVIVRLFPPSEGLAALPAVRTHGPGISLKPALFLARRPLAFVS
jgi:hypothetical protein